MSLKSIGILLLEHWISTPFLKGKHARGNQIPFMTKDLSKSIMVAVANGRILTALYVIF